MTVQQAFELAVRLTQSGQLDQAESLFRRIVSARPDDPQSHYNLGKFLAEKGDISSAVASYEQSLRLRPTSPEALNNLGELMRQSGQIDRAVQLLGAAVLARPDFAQAHFNLALAIADQDRVAESIVEAQLATALLPSSPEAWNLLGNLSRENNAVDQAIASYQKAIALRPDYPDAQWHLALVLLLKGDFAEGWRAYEARRQIRSIWREPGFSQPYWDGGDLYGRTILLWAEQGFGDTIQFIRYVPMVKERGGQVVVLCQPELRRLLASQSWLDRVYSYGDKLPEFNVQCPLMSLPHLLGTTLETIPKDVPYLSAIPAEVAGWKQRMRSSRRNVGLVWATKPAAPASGKRSIGLDAMAALAALAGTTFWSLQGGDAAAEAKSPPAGMELIDCSRELHNFADTAGVIANLDLVVACDTAVAHLAGAMGVPVWIALPHAAPWRWMLERKDSPWYPSARLFRQDRPGDWSGPMKAIAEHLKTGARLR